MNITLSKSICAWVFLLFTVFMGSCISLKQGFRQEYSRAWKETIKSQAWENSLRAGITSIPSQNTEFYSTTSDVSTVEPKLSRLLVEDTGFMERYHSLVSRAYYKIIAEAENSDDRLRNEYNRLISESEESGSIFNRELRKDLALASKRFNAHREMLEGLKSWNILSEYGTNDLDFFKEEHFNDVYKMYKDGQKDEGIIDFLVYKLADLYHFND